MVQKKIDSRIRTLIENGVKLNQRTLMIIIGDNGKDQVGSSGASVTRRFPICITCFPSRVCERVLPCCGATRRTWDSARLRWWSGCHGLVTRRRECEKSRSSSVAACTTRTERTRSTCSCPARKSAGATTRTRRTFWVRPTACWFCRTSSPSRPTFCAERSRRWREAASSRFS